MMTLGQALVQVQQRKEQQRRRKIFLVCGFQPLHLVTFLQGHFASRFPDEAADIQTGLYGDLEQTMLKAEASHADAAVLVVEWSDLDPRLGLRSTGGWAFSLQPDIVATCRERFARLLTGMKRLGVQLPVALIPPTMQFSLLGHTPGWQLSETEADLQKESALFLAEAVKLPGITILNSASLNRTSPEAARLDVGMELKAGFPYTIPHASAVASQAIQLLFPPSPMKGLITDLDETFWSGIVGDVGVQGVSWSLADHTAIHGLYQQMLGHLAEMGVLLAIASKNDLSLVEETLRRDGLLVPAKSFFPIAANWGAKSSSIAEIIRTWNIAPDSVVFVDDSPMELEEVRTAFPAMKCLQFSKKHPEKTMAMLEQLRDLFGKPAVHREDTLRQSSIRANAAIQAEAGSASVEFLRGLQGRLTFQSRKDPENRRLLELINKTNQFNLNGVRLAEGEWMRHLSDPSSIVSSVSYEDKFGPLGVIGVVAGRQEGSRLEVSTWVMSCRAFSRRIELHTLQHLFHLSGVDEISLCFQVTERNEPLQQFLRLIGGETDGTGHFVISREAFEHGAHDLPHGVEVIAEPLSPL